MNIKQGKRKIIDRVFFEAMPKLIVEIGTSRHSDSEDGQATSLLDSLAEQFNTKVVSVDVDSDAIANARPNLKHTILVHEDGAVYLGNMTDSVDLLYLDGSDDPNEAWAQFKLAPLHSGSVVLVDDAMNYGGNIFGKATKIIRNVQGWNVELTPFIGRYKMAILRRSPSKI